jgi:hypothetical protein
LDMELKTPHGVAARLGCSASEDTHVCELDPIWAGALDMGCSWHCCIVTWMGLHLNAGALRRLRSALRFSGLLTSLVVGDTRGIDAGGGIRRGL